MKTFMSINVYDCKSVKEKSIYTKYILGICSII